MQGFVASSIASSAAEAGKEVASKIAAGISGAKVAMTYGSCDYDSAELLAAIAAELPGVPVLGNTSFTGIVTPEGYIGGDTPFVGILALGGDDVVIGTAGASRETDEGPRFIGKKLAEEAMKAAGKDCPPDYWYMAASPAEEEYYIKGVTDVIGRIPFFGGSAADNTIEGWTLTTSGTGYKGSVAYACFEVWNHTFNLGQVLYGMPSGTFRLTAQAFYRNGGKDNAADTDVHALLYIGNETAQIAPISRGANNNSGAGDWYTYATNKKVPNDMEAAAAAFNDLHRYRPTSSVNTLTADYDATTSTRFSVGMKKTRAVADDWTIMNNFTLSYLGNAGSNGIGEVQSATRKVHSETYDLSGRRVAKPVRGLYIRNGRKMVVK